MPAYNTRFDLGLEDLDLIETALQTRKTDLSLKRLHLLAEEGDGSADAAAELDRINQSLSETHELMGRLHNQKVFYRPRAQAAPYVGG